MKKIILLITLLFLLKVDVLVLGSDFTVEKVVENANKELGGIYYEIDKVNRDVWLKYRILVYNQPYDDQVNNEYRYLGNTPLGEPMPNPRFPPDHKATTIINDWAWIKEPWCNERLSLGSTSWDDDPETLPYIKNALAEKYKNLFKMEYPKPDESWEKYTKILQPRTSVTPGLGRLWHRWNGADWYITIIIPNIIIDIEAAEISQQSPVLTDTNQVASAVFKNNGSQDESFVAEYYVNGKKVHFEELFIGAGTTKTRNFSWKSSKSPGTDKLKIQAVPVSEENNTGNNSKEINVAVQNPNYAKPDCEFTSKLNSAWNETYEWVESYDCSWTDQEGVSHSDTCYENRSQTVGYSESLKTVIAINTKQGISTDPRNPQESDRESRGSWEIIPWASKNGLNANEVTRAGYGFEVKVETTYWTDWETRVSGGASPHGGQYKGPTHVVAQFFDTANRFVEQVELVPTGGTRGERNTTWELPLSIHTFPDGKTIQERKHYTRVNIADGKYTVRIIILDCGREPLSICQDKHLTIYGDMYDDIYTRPAKRDE